MSVQSKDKKFRIAVFDLDGTITRKDTYVDFLVFCLKKRPSRILCGGALVVYLLFHKAGYRSNHWLKAKFLGTVAGGLGGYKLEEICREFCIRTAAKNFKPSALAELNQLREDGFQLVLATASFDFYVHGLFELLNMDHLLCSKAQLDSNGKLTGALDGRNCIGAEKANRLRDLCAEQGWPKIERAYSDDIVDLPLFQMAEKALVVDPKPATESQADGLGYEVINWR